MTTNTIQAVDCQAIDCDVHPTVPSMHTLLPYLDDFWREMVIERDILSLDSISYPPNVPISARPDFKTRSGRAGLDAPEVATHVFDKWQSSIAILNCLYGIQLVFNEDMALAFARALNDWIVKEWLDRDPRLRASIVVPLQNVEHAVDEIERCAKDKRFVQILVLCMGETPLGRRQFWPVYAAAERHGLPLGIHAGSAYRYPVTSLGWPSYYVEDYAAQSLGFQSQLASLVCEGVYVKFPNLKTVLLESGVTWLPGFVWRLSKFWRGVRAEIPWIDRSPNEIVRDHFRLTIQPLDAPDDPNIVARVIEHFQSDDMLLYASDYPHWQFDGEAPMPSGIPARLHRKILVDNPLATYGRLGL
ncbi:amidohydrolase family protein [Roseiarcaceae bacterium H3SJ34-1]|uniref:amidohydrolase family protein n=1 Tax=Terripilifer ovatus TaxID=3032367 RepID=UPI003AB9A715|nr:amidohydrolase family protein [Roseiarcaceae bacterium H3SJ34-1]